MTSEQTNAIFIDRKFPWMGKHSGYDVVLDYLAKVPSLNIRRISGNTCPSLPIFDHLLSAYVARARKSLNYNRFGLWSEICAAVAARRCPADFIHVLYVESHFLKLPRLIPKGVDLWATAHQPPSLWKSMRHDPALLEKLDQLIVLSSESQRFFEDILPGRVHFVPHGVDVDFFSPAEVRCHQDEDFRCVFSGKWLRDLETLELVIAEVSRKNSQIKFDMIVPVDDRRDEHFLRLAAYDNVQWHANLSDEQLRELYRRAGVLLLPLIDCTANNALLEGISCGVPVITNRIGGIVDYTNEDFASLFAVGDVAGMVECVFELAENNELRKSQGEAAREYAVNHLSWQDVASRLFDLYQKQCEDIF